MRVYIVYIRYIQYIQERGEKVQIIISNSSEKPIYEQITMQIKNMIINGELKPGDALFGEGITYQCNNNKESI